MYESGIGSVSLSAKERKEAVAWLMANLPDLESAPARVRSGVKEIFEHLSADRISQKNFNAYSRQLARALGLLPSSERRRSGRALAPTGIAPRRKPKTKREQLAQEIEDGDMRTERYSALAREQTSKTDRLKERFESMPYTADELARLAIDDDPSTEKFELTEEQKTECAAEGAAMADHLRLGNGADPTLQAPPEALMTGHVVSLDEEFVYLGVDLPDDVSEESVVKTLTQTRERYDVSMTVTRLELEVEKKVVVDKDGTRRVYSASTSDFGPPRFSVTWNTLATLAVMVGQFAMPFNRLATMLSTSFKRFSSGSLSRMAHYVATRFVPIYLELCDQLADSAVLAGDDTSCRVVEVSSHFSKPPKDEEREWPPWVAYRTTEDAERGYAFVSKMKEVLLERRQQGDREAKRTPVDEPSLCVLVGRELDFESPRRDGRGAKESLNTTVLTGRGDDNDPQSAIVFYRSHLGSLGNLLEMLLKKRKPSARTLTVQADLSTTNLVTDPDLNKRFDISIAGCMSHARRPFALYEDQDPVWTPNILHLFKGVAMHEDILNRCGRNRENVLAVRGKASRPLWESIKKMAKEMLEYWSKATPLGAGARYILRHFDKLTAYLDDPRLDATNNLRERLLRTEKLIEKSSMFRRTIEGRAVLDILRTILQTAVAAGVPAQEYLIDVMRAPPDEIEAHPENFTPRAWLERQQAEPSEDQIVA